MKTDMNSILNCHGFNIQVGVISEMGKKLLFRLHSRPGVYIVEEKYIFLKFDAFIYILWNALTWLLLIKPSKINFHQRLILSLQFPTVKWTRPDKTGPGTNKKLAFKHNL